MASEKVKIVTNENFDQEVMKADQPVVLDFWAPWCGPCRAIAPVMDELANEYDGKVKVCKVNVDEEGDIAAKFRIMSIPTIMFFQEGKSVDKVIGARTKEELSNIIQKML